MSAAHSKPRHRRGAVQLQLAPELLHAHHAALLASWRDKKIPKNANLCRLVEAERQDGSTDPLCPSTPEPHAPRPGRRECLVSCSALPTRPRHARAVAPLRAAPRYAKRVAQDLPAPACAFARWRHMGHGSIADTTQKTNSLLGTIEARLWRVWDPCLPRSACLPTSQRYAKIRNTAREFRCRHCTHHYYLGGRATSTEARCLADEPALDTSALSDIAAAALMHKTLHSTRIAGTHVCTVTVILFLENSRST